MAKKECEDESMNQVASTPVEQDRLEAAKQRAAAILEQAKQQIDYVKHIATLSTGSILLLAGFLEKVFKMPHWKILISLSFGSFMVSVLMAVVFQSITVTSQNFFMETELSPKAKLILVICIFGMWLSFLVGIGAFTVFAIRNFAE